MYKGKQKEKRALRWFKYNVIHVPTRHLRRPRYGPALLKGGRETFAHRSSSWSQHWKKLCPKRSSAAFPKDFPPSSHLQYLHFRLAHTPNHVPILCAMPCLVCNIRAGWPQSHLKTTRGCGSSARVKKVHSSVAHFPNHRYIFRLSTAGFPHISWFIAVTGECFSGSVRVVDRSRGRSGASSRFFGSRGGRMRSWGSPFPEPAHVALCKPTATVLRLAVVRLKHYRFLPAPAVHGFRPSGRGERRLSTISRRRTLWIDSLGRGRGGPQASSFGW